MITGFFIDLFFKLGIKRNCLEDGGDGVVLFVFLRFFFLQLKGFFVFFFNIYLYVIIIVIKYIWFYYWLIFYIFVLIFSLSEKKFVYVGGLYQVISGFLVRSIYLGVVYFCCVLGNFGL